MNVRFGPLWLIAVALLAQNVAYSQVSRQPNPGEESEIAAISRALLRDSAELPMDVTVTTVTTDAAGLRKTRLHSTVRLIFHGYNREAGRFAFNAQSGWFNTGALQDSLPGHFAVFDAFSRFVQPKDAERKFEIVDVPGHGHRLILSPPGDCSQFELGDGQLFPRKYCSTVEVVVNGAQPTPLGIEQISLVIGTLPARGRLRYLGPVTIRKMRTVSEIQAIHLPGDQQPFYIPSRVITTIETDRGNVELTNEYKASANRAGTKK